MILPLTTRDASFVLANLRPLDDVEVSCQYEPYNVADMAYACSHTPYAFTAFYRNTPALIFGAVPTMATTVSAWALGTKHTRRVAPMVTKFVTGPLREQLVKDGYRWAEARSIEGHEDAHRWIKHMGGDPTANLPSYGKDGENFVLFRGALDV